jgi:H+/gluconate symporter-like permease
MTNYPASWLPLYNNFYQLSMLTQQEKDFVRYWEQNRLRRKRIFRQFLVGIPIGLLFAVPIAISLKSGWDKRAALEANSPDFNPLVLVFALLLIVVFIAIFNQQHKWDQYEQRYRELLNRPSEPPSALEHHPAPDQPSVTEEPSPSAVPSPQKETFPSE